MDRCLGVQPRWQVVITANVLARPLVEEVQREIARRGAWAITQLTWDGNGGAWMREAADELLAEPAPLHELIQQNADAFIVHLGARKRARHSRLPAARVALAQAANATCAAGRWRWRCPGWCASSRPTRWRRRRG